MARTYTFHRAADLNRMLRSLSRTASARLRQAAQGISDDVAVRASGRARSVGGVAVRVASSLRSRRDRVPAVQMGGRGKLPGRHGENQTVGNVIWGAEFGGGRRPTTRQFDPWRGNGPDAGYFLYPTVRAMSDEIMERYGDAVMQAVDQSAKGAA